MVAIATKEHTVVAYSYLPGNPNDDPLANVRRRRRREMGEVYVSRLSVFGC